MASLSDILFGTKSKAKTKQHPTLTPEQQEALRAIIGDAEISPEGISTGEEDVISAALGRQPGQQALVSDAQSRLGELLGSREEFDEFFSTNVEQPLMERFQEDVIPGIGRRFGGAGFFSSERRAAEERGMEELAQELTAGRSQAAITAPLQAMNALQPVLGAQEGLDDLALQLSGLKRRTTEQQRQQRIQELLQSLGVQGFENITTVRPGTEGILHGFSKAAGAAVGSAAGGSIF